ncbi:hypothetical protein AC1031_022052 [Aphanomyces cochlioides]|nr:hypothetical protein AC1031_022052 [Aphanomyces cochlioides]
MYYVLADGIYPNYTLFQKSMSSPSNQKEKFYCERHESVRKDVERCFGALFGRFHILSNPGRLWSRETMHLVWKACICLHNMVIQVEETVSTPTDETQWQCNIDLNRVDSPISFQHYIQMTRSIRNEAAHNMLRNDIIEELWQKLGCQ